MNQSNQPDPTPNGHPATWDAVMNDLRYGSWPMYQCVRVAHLVADDARERDRLGAEKYGTRLQPFNSRDSLRDAYEEALDLMVYLHNAFTEGKVDRKLYVDALVMTVRIRIEIYKRDGK